MHYTRLVLGSGIIYLLLSGGCQQALTDHLKNPQIVIKPGQSSPSEWVIEANDNFILDNTYDQGQQVTRFSAEQGGQIIFSQEVLLDSGDYFLLVRFYTRIKQGEFFIGAGEKKLFITRQNLEVCERTVLTLTADGPQKTKISFGFRENSVGRAYVVSIQLVKVHYIFPGENADLTRQYVRDKLDIQGDFNLNLDKNIAKLAKALNQTLLTKNQPLALTMAPDNVFTSTVTPFFYRYSHDRNIRDSYCQKSSLSLDDLLGLFNVPARQIHWQKNCTGFHQFLEYWHPKERKWKILDPYYGITYVDSKGMELNFEEVERMVNEGCFSAKNIKKLAIGRLLYNEEEIITAWYSSTLAIYVN